MAVIPLTADLLTPGLELAAHLRSLAFRYHNEAQLHDLIEGVMLSRGRAEREVRLGDAGRIDLLAGRVGVEVKVAGSPSAVRRQLARYAQHDRVDELLLVTTRSTHAHGMPAAMGGVPVHVVVVNGGRL